VPVPTNKKFFAGKSQNDIASNILAIFGPKLSLATVAARQDEGRRTHLHAPRVPETFIINKLFMKNE